MKKKIKNILGLTILEALMATAVVGIGFVAILSMVNYSVQSIDTSGERTKANYLVSMMAEDVIGHRHSVYGVNTNTEDVIIDADGTITIEGVERPNARRFSDHLAGQEFTTRCVYPFNRIVVNPHGFVVACTADFHDKLSIGDVKKNSLKEIWESDTFKFLRKKHLEDEFEGLFCNKCLNNIT